MSKLFLDANILLETLFSRTKQEQVVILLHDPTAHFYISTLTVHIVHYFAERAGLAPELANQVIDLAEPAPLLAAHVQQANERYDGKDFEDCLQAACAEAAGCDQIVTLDKHFKKHSGTRLPVLVL